jgi:hypothetical protein
MKSLAAAFAAALLTFTGAAAAQTPAPNPASNPEMTRLFQEDQAARKAANIDWSVVGVQDAQRREATRRLLDAGRLTTGEDFHHAAFVFQHGSEPGDFLLAHTLATVAVGKGHGASLWIAGATLDRYLVTIGQKQIYGTQFTLPRGAGAWTQEPYDPALVPDALRKELGVPIRAEQRDNLEAMNRRLKASRPAPPAAR